MSNRLILIAVAGSIAAYRSCELVRSLSKRNLPVRVVMTENAERFVGRVTFEALTGRSVFTSEWEQGMPHIELREDVAVMAVVPATANLIGKMANGIADDLVSSLYLAATFPVIVAPAMNPFMYAAPAVQRNLRRLNEDKVTILDPASGVAVCGDEGQGKLAAIGDIEAAILAKYSAVR